MTARRTGWIIFIAALGSMLGLMSVEVIELESWSQASTPGFIGKSMAHAATTILAFVGGKLIPTRNDEM